MPKSGQSLFFFLHDEVDGEPLTPANIDVFTLHQFMTDVIHLVQGDFKRTDLGQPRVTISDGSVKLGLLVPAFVSATVIGEMETLQGTQDLDSVSPQRAAVIEQWQQRSVSDGSHRSYSFCHEKTLSPETILMVTASSEFRHKQRDLWVRAEKYITGRVVGIGGKTKPNIHVVVSDGRSLKVDATEDQLQGADFLYQDITLNVSAREHLQTGELRELRLIEVTKPAEEIDHVRLGNLWEKGREAWKHVGNPTEWVESLRSS